MVDTPLQQQFADSEEFVAALLAYLKEKGGECYFGEPVSQLEHALQTAYLARHAGAEDPLVGAALLHDIGHLLVGNTSPIDADLGHEKIGAQLLARWFAPAVAIPVALHVCAKRYLVSVDPSYSEGFSLASQQSLQWQGGPFEPEQAQQFAKLPFAQEAIWLRRWDDLAKRVGKSVPPLQDYYTLIQSLAHRSQLVEHLLKATPQ